MSEVSEECSVCYNETTRFTPCKHPLCKVCEDEWRKTENSCPTCKKSLDKDKEVIKPSKDLVAIEQIGDLTPEQKELLRVQLAQEKEQKEAVATEEQRLLELAMKASLNQTLEVKTTVSTSQGLSSMTSITTTTSLPRHYSDGLEIKTQVTLTRQPELTEDEQLQIALANSMSTDNDDLEFALALSVSTQIEQKGSARVSTKVEQKVSLTQLEKECLRDTQHCEKCSKGYKHIAYTMRCPPCIDKYGDGED